MTPITTTVHNGKVEVVTPNWPEGCEVLIQPLETAASVDLRDEDAPQTSGEGDCSTVQAGQSAWLDWYNALEPLVFSPEEEADIAAWREQVKAHSTDNRNRQIEDLFQ